MTPDQKSKPPMAKAERLGKALRENLKRRKAQLRGRGGMKVAPEDRPQPPKKP